MSISTFQALQAKLAAPTQSLRSLAAATSPAQGAATCPLTSEWITGSRWPASGTTPTTTAATCDRTLAGALAQFNKSGAEQRAWLRRFDIAYGSAVQGTGCFFLVDRLAHVGGLSGIVTTAQTVAFPALTRFTSGLGVIAAVEIYTTIGATGTTATISYTNTVPTAGQTSQPIAIGGTGLNNLRRVLPISLAAGDLGVTAVASITLLATTGTAGNFGVTLYKILGAWPSVSVLPYLLSGTPLPNFGMMPVIPDNACLQLLYTGMSAGANTNMAVIDFFED